MGSIGPEKLLDIEGTQQNEMPSDSGFTEETQVSGELNDTPVSEGKSIPTEEAGQNMDKEFKPEDKEQSYLELERKLSEQGKELGEYRKFYEEAAPVIDFIQKDETLLNAVLDRLYTPADGAKPEANSVVDTSVTGDMPVEDAQAKQQQQTHNEEASADVMRAVDDRIKSYEDKRKFEQEVDKFIESHPDFHEKLPKILEVIDKHGIEKDIELAYKMATYDELQKKISEKNKVQEEQKGQAESVGGTPQGVQGDLQTKDAVWDVMGKPNDPNASFRGS